MLDVGAALRTAAWLFRRPSHHRVVFGELLLYALVVLCGAARSLLALRNSLPPAVGAERLERLSQNFNLAPMACLFGIQRENNHSPFAMVDEIDARPRASWDP